MKVAIVGQGAAGLFLALLLVANNKKHNIDLTLIDKNINIGRKLYVTGNGRCNLANQVVDHFSYNQEPAFKLTKETNYISEIKFFRELGIMTRNIDNLVYPYSLSAAAFTDYIIKILKDNKVRFINKANLIDYVTTDKEVTLKFIDKTLNFDKLVIATGGKSHKVLGSDGVIFEILRKHKYKINTLKPGLVPIKVLENVKPVENERLKCSASLVLDGQVAYKEEGEVLFKKDGLSGICIFDISSMIARDPGFKNAKIYLDLFSDLPEDTLLSQFISNNKVSKYNFLEGYFNKNMAEYIRKMSGCKNLMNFDNSDLKRIVKFTKAMPFTYKESYGFDDSQVTVGGVDIKMVNDNFASVNEKNVFLLGEVLDLDGLCGGYNLMLIFAEANKLKDYLLK
jgi:flavoprotein, HI0933 family